jgi:alanine racemase
MSLAQARRAAELGATLGRPLPVGLHVDTGMNRQGLAPAEAMALAASPQDLRHLDVNLLMSHLGGAAVPGDPRNASQLEAFRSVRRLFPRARASLSASAGAFLGEAYRFDQVRPGVSLYGGGPQERPDSRLRAVATLQAPLLDVRRVAAGETIGYSPSARAERDMLLGIVAAGYADGVIRAAAGRGYAWAGGARRRLVIVTMNMIGIDAEGGGLQPGDPVELLGPHVALDDLAQAAGSVAHECLTRLSVVGDRRYLGGE